MYSQSMTGIDERSLAAAELEVAECFDDYEQALVANDIDAMDRWFWDDPGVVRFGIAEIQYGADAVRTWRKDATPVPVSRTITGRTVRAFSPELVTVDITFVNGEGPPTGRQSQLWIRVDGSWRIARAHVSMID